jgi:hypothetical protein
MGVGKQRRSPIHYWWESPIHYWWESKQCNHNGNKKLRIELPCNPAVSLLGIYLREYKSTYNSETCTPIFIPTLFTIVKLWNQPRYLTTDE